MTAPDWTQSFHSYSPVHAAVVVTLVAVAGSLTLLRRRWADTPHARRLDIVLGILALIVWLWMRTFKVLPGRWDPSKALPLQVCDIAGLIAPLVLWTARRALRAMLYFGGLGLSSQAFIQPDLNEGPNDPSFWVFWLAHGSIVATAIYDIAARGYRPGWRDYGVAVAALIVYLAVILPVDLVMGYNYGYVGNDKPGQPTVVDILGPWPARIFTLSALVAVGLAMFVIPWDIAKRARGPTIALNQPTG